MSTSNLYDLADQKEETKVMNRLRFKHGIKPIPKNTDEIITAKQKIRKDIDRLIKLSISYPFTNRNLRVRRQFIVRLREGWRQANCIFESPLLASRLEKLFPDDFSYEVLKVRYEVNAIFKHKNQAWEIRMAFQIDIRFNES